MKGHSSAQNPLASIGKLMKTKPETAAALGAFDQQVFKEGVLSTKTKELIAVGVAHATRCPCCIEVHVKRALDAGASNEEIAEAVFVGVALSAGAAFALSGFAMNALKEWAKAL